MDSEITRAALVAFITLGSPKANSTDGDRVAYQKATRLVAAAINLITRNELPNVPANNAHALRDAVHALLSTGAPKPDNLNDGRLTIYNTAVEALLTSNLYHALDILGNSVGEDQTDNITPDNMSISDSESVASQHESESTNGTSQGDTSGDADSSQASMTTLVDGEDARNTSQVNKETIDGTVKFIDGEAQVSIDGQLCIIRAQDGQITEGSKIGSTIKALFQPSEAPEPSPQPTEVSEPASQAAEVSEPASQAAEVAEPIRQATRVSEPVRQAALALAHLRASSAARRPTVSPWTTMPTPRTTNRDPVPMAGDVNFAPIGRLLQHHADGVGVRRLITQLRNFTSVLPEDSEVVSQANVVLNGYQGRAATSRIIHDASAYVNFAIRTRPSVCQMGSTFHQLHLVDKQNPFFVEPQPKKNWIPGHGLVFVAADDAA